MCRRRRRAGAGRAVPAGRLLPEPRRLVLAEHARRRPRHLRLPLVRIQQQGAFLSFFLASMDDAQVRLLMAPSSRSPSCAIWGRGTASAPCTGRARAPISPSAPALETSRYNLQLMHIARKSHNREENLTLIGQCSPYTS